MIHTIVDTTAGGKDAAAAKEAWRQDLFSLASICFVRIGRDGSLLLVGRKHKELAPFLLVKINIYILSSELLLSS